MRRLVVLLPLLLAGCGDTDFSIGPGMADFTAPLCGDYYLIRSSAHTIKVSPLSYGSSRPIIPAKVVKLGHGNRFIIAKQNVLRRRSPEDPQDTYMEPDRGNFQYWILDTAKPEVYGPFSKHRFNAKRHELGVPAAIRLEDVYSYRTQNESTRATE